MAISEVVIICFSVVISISIMALAWHYSSMRKEQMRQYGITSRKAMELGNAGVNSPLSPQGGDLWVTLASQFIQSPMAQELMKNPQVQEAISKLILPRLTAMASTSSSPPVQSEVLQNGKI